MNPIRATLRRARHASVLSLTVFSLLLSACTGATPVAPTATTAASTAAPTDMPAAPEVTISYWFYPEFKNVAGHEADSVEYGDWERYQAEQFMADYPNVTIETNLIPFGEGYQTMLNAISAGAPPDIAREGLVRISQYAALGVTEDLSADLSAEEKADFSQESLDLFSFDGRLAAYPHFAFTGMIVVNKTLFEAAGAADLLPTGEGRNWDHAQFLEAARAVTNAPDTYGVTFPAGDQTADFMNHAYIRSFGASLFNADGSQVAENSPEGVQGLQFMMDIVNEGLTPPGAASEDYYTAFSLFVQGRVGMIVGGGYTWQEVAAGVADAGGDPIELYGVNFPSVGGQGFPAAAAPTGLVVFEQDDPVKREWVTRFAAYLASEENQEAECRTANQLCFRASLQSLAEGVPGLADEQAIRAGNALGDIGWRSPFYAAIRPTFFPELQAALLGQKTAEQALNDFAAAANALIAQQ